MTVRELIENLKEYDETSYIAIYDLYKNNVCKIEGTYKCSNAEVVIIEISANKPCIFG